MSVTWGRTSTVTPLQALEVLRREHTPYVPQVVSVLDDTVDAVWRDPTFDEQVESEAWCDGCNRAADRCTVTTLLALVDLRPWWRRLLPRGAAGPYPSSAIPSDSE